MEEERRRNVTRICAAEQCGDRLDRMASAFLQRKTATILDCLNTTSSEKQREDGLGIGNLT